MSCVGTRGWGHHGEVAFVGPHRDLFYTIVSVIPTREIFRTDGFVGVPVAMVLGGAFFPWCSYDRRIDADRAIPFLKRLVGHELH